MDSGAAWGFRGMSTTQASEKKLNGHATEQEFAYALGGEVIHGRGKADVRDGNGATYSVKGNSAKWQIFLYGAERLRQTPTAIAQLMLQCLENFPADRSVYLQNKSEYKQRLMQKMVALKDELLKPAERLKFLKWALFEGSCDFLTIYSSGDVGPLGFHIFPANFVVEALAKQTSVENSRARSNFQFDNQKVRFVDEKGHTLGEIELRNDSDAHYREIKFWLGKPQTTALLVAHARSCKQDGKVFRYA
jgi:hypothetical protein